MKKVFIFTLLCMTFAALHTMEQSETATLKENPVPNTEGIVLPIAKQLQELVKKLVEPIAPSSHGFSSSPTIKGKKYKEIKGEKGNDDIKKTYAIYPTGVEDEKRKVTILKAPFHDHQIICTINSPYFENIETIQSQRFDDTNDLNESLRKLVTLLHQFQAETESLPETELLTKYKIACKVNKADVMPFLKGKVLLLLLSPELSLKTSSESSPQSSPSPKKKRKSLKKTLSQALHELVALNVTKKP